MSIKKEEFIREYVKAIKMGKAAIFGGAGLSRPSGFVDWKELLRPMAADIGLDIDKETDMLSVAQFYKNKRKSRAGISQAILDAFSAEVQTNENIQIITRLPIYTYWTTNYDVLIEKGVREANRNPDVKSETTQLPYTRRDMDAVVYKMHGDINQPNDTVLTKEDYELYELHRPLFRTVLKGDLLSKIFLFIGFSFEDPNLDFILGQIHSLLGENIPTHYCFSKRLQECEFDDYTEFIYYKTRQDMREENLQNYGIQTVFVDSYSEITGILREIERRIKLNNIFISGSIGAYDDIWNKQQAEELAEKLAQKLVHYNYRITSGFGIGLGSAVINGALDIIYREKYRHIDEYLCLRPFPQNISDSTIRMERWKQYRESIVEENGICVFMFGNKIDPSGNIVIADGCIQEFEIAKAKGNVIIPIGSTGYAARKIYDEVKNNINDYSYLDKVIDKLGSETNIDNIVSLILSIVQNLAS